MLVGGALDDAVGVDCFHCFFVGDGVLLGEWVGGHAGRGTRPDIRTWRKGWQVLVLGARSCCVKVSKIETNSKSLAQKFKFVPEYYDLIWLSSMMPPEEVHYHHDDPGTSRT